MSKWTGGAPNSKEKHFLVTQLIKPNLENESIEHIKLQADSRYKIKPKAAVPKR